MLLIFDLDDTLIETTAILTAEKLKKSLVKMIETGLIVFDRNKAQQVLLRMNLGAHSTRDLLTEFVELYGGNESHVEVAMNVIDAIDLEQYEITPAYESMELLTQWKKDCQLALVTRGRDEMQKEKLNRFGLNSSLFCEVVVTPYFDKGKHYDRLCTKYGFDPAEVVVIGDRIDADLAPAKELGMKTVHVKKGRGANSHTKREIVDYTIYELQELSAFLQLQAKPLEMV